VASKRNAAIEAMIEEATVDAYNDDEQLTGLYTMIEGNLALPFTTTILAVEVTVKNVDLAADTIVAICTRGRDRQRTTSSTYHCPPRHRTAPNGSTPTGTGQDGN
jgi:hypothetical protein